MVGESLYFLVIKISTQKDYYKNMEIRENEKVCIFTPLSQTLNTHECSRLLKNIKKDSREIAIDLNYVEECSIDFINTIKEVCATKKIGIFNIPSDIFTIFNIMQIDKCASLYVSEIDFEANKRQLINRQFTVF